MPVIAMATFGIKVGEGENPTIEIIKQEIEKCGCANTANISEALGQPVEHLIEVLRDLVDKKEIVCNKDFSVCCADGKKLEEFSKKLKALKRL